jgi:PAS domain S-box-containing protein
MSCDDIGLFGEIFKSVNEFIFEHDLQGRFTGICPRFVGFLGYSREELLGLTARDLLLEKDREHFQSYLDRVLARGKTRVSSSSSPR